MTVSAEGRVENQKLNQTAALLSFGWVFGFQLDSLEKNVFTLAGFTFTPGQTSPRPQLSASTIVDKEHDNIEDEDSKMFLAPAEDPATTR